MDFPELHLGSLKRQNNDSRVVIRYATAGNHNSIHTPVLVFPTHGDNRRSLALLHQAAVQHNLKLICVSRSNERSNNQRDKTTQQHVFLKDMIYVLEHLNIYKVSLLSMGTGTPLALAFASRYSNYTAGIFMAISPHVNNDDHRKRSVFGSVTRGPLTKRTTSIRGLRKRLTKSEQILFDKTLAHDEEFTNTLQWIQEEPEGCSNDECVLQSSSRDLGIDYAKLAAQQRHIVLWHGGNDKVVPHGNVEWLSRQLDDGCCEVHVMSNASHEGLMTISLYPLVVQSFSVFRVW
jgi:pimeloyl-ACP methyl ester carboxylesterase